MKVLVAEDDCVSRLLLETTLSDWGYEVVVAQDGREAWHLLQREGAPQLALLDWVMPEMDGVEVCQRVRQVTKAPYVYILMLTAKAKKEDIIEAMEAGADDYISKPFDNQELQVRLRAGRRIMELQQTLQIQATRDGLTGAWNHAMILDIFQRELARASRVGKPLSIIMADLDHFKTVNDTYGHLTGDLVLEETARRIGASLRSYDALGRYGGEEFLIILPGCDASNALDVAERVRHSIAINPIEIASAKVPITLSLGVTVSNNAQPFDAKLLIELADQALYRSKRHGRNCIEMVVAPAELTAISNNSGAS